MPEQPTIPTEHLLAQALEIAGQFPKAALVMDVDETLGNGFEKYWKIISRLIKQNHPKLTLPTHEHALEVHDIKSAFPKELASEIKTIMDKLRNHRISVRNLALMHPKLASILTQVRDQGHPVAMYLTTRPDSLAELTAIELQRNAFPTAPIIARPALVDSSQTTPWKLSVLKDFAEKSPHGIIMVDDSITLNAAITEAGLPNLNSILIVGPITPANSSAITWDQFTDHLQTFA